MKENTLEMMKNDDQANVRLSNGLISLEFDKATGRWLSLADESDGTTLMQAGELLSPLLLTVNGRTLGTRGFNQMFTLADAETVGLKWVCEKVAIESGAEGMGCAVVLFEGNWRAEIHTGLRAGSRRVERKVILEYTGEGEAKLRSFQLRMPFADIGPAEECFIEAPGHPTRTGARVSSLWHGPWGGLVEGAFNDCPAWRPPFVGIHHPEARRSLAAWAWTETEPFFPHAERSREGVLLSHRVYLAGRFVKGHRLEWGTQYLEVFPTEWMEALSRLQEFYGEVGLIAPALPDWAQRINLYEVHVGRLAPTKLAPYPDYEPLIADLPKIKAKGYDAVYIMPHVPYPSYSVIDYKDMEIQQGSDKGFREFIARSHELGLKVMMDVTIHGVMDRRARRGMRPRSASNFPLEPTMPEEHPYLSQNPEWFSENEHGEGAMTYTYSFDHASRSWQEFMAEVFAYYVHEYDLDGFRVDSHTWNFFPNWAKGLPYPASGSFYGSAALFTRIEKELAAIKPGVALYTETAGPLLHGSHALGYNYDETWMLVNMVPMLSRQGVLCHGLQAGHVTGWRMSAWDMAEWLAQRRLAMPKGAVKVRSLDNHDTYWPSHEFRRETFGVEAAKAMAACFAFLDGGFMDYNGADEGLEAFYAQLVHLRRTVPALARGECDYLAVRPSAPMVFSPLWEQDGRFALPAINFDRFPAETSLPLPAERFAAESGYRVYDHMAGVELPGPTKGTWRRGDLTALTVNLPAYGVMLLEIAPAK